MAKLSHKFAGSAAVFGAIKVCEKLKQIEAKAKVQPAKVTVADIAALDALCQKTDNAFAHPEFGRRVFGLNR